ncbi:hypothetical protein LTR64_004159 [Lithohypha guttulata]|uniref:uncharacterized protein n=1 Tax=Lithohypha guttulata TaxID=1690604 RepID=UPI002DDFD2E1|nr:hypothetical protein LTR51_006547 [Lithohypha guttulata]
MARPPKERSSLISAATLVNGEMPAPPLPPSPARSSPAATRRKAPSVSQMAGTSSIPPAKSAHAPKKPSIAKYVLAVIISFVAEAAGQTAGRLAPINLGGSVELAAVSRGVVTDLETAGYVAWKIGFLTVCWFGGLDAVDVASLNTLIQTPIFILLHYFYLISAPTLLTTCTVSILAPALPFYLLRPLSAPHAGKHTKARAGLRNRIIINDPVTTLATSATATIVYASTLQFAFSTFLPVFLVQHFDGLRDLTFAHDIARTLPSLCMWLAPAGIASTQFLFRPAEGATGPETSTSATGPNSIALTHNHFDPETATFAQHVYHNVWGWYTSRQKELIGRTIVLGVFLLLENVVHVWGTIQGVDAVGAAGYGGLWLIATIVLGAWLDFVGGPSD